MVRSLVLAAAPLAAGCTILFSAPDAPCPPPDDDTVALYTFEGADRAIEVADEAGDNLAASPEVPLRTVDGPPGCGEALALGSSGSPLVISHSDVFDLEEGSVDLWLFLEDQPPAEFGILTRDAAGTNEAGHFLLHIDADSGRAVTRLQGLDGEPDGVVCADDALPRERWVHLAVNFGPPSLELFVDRQLQAGGGGEVVLGPTATPCRQTTARGIDGNGNPWVIGAATLASRDGDYERLESYLVDAALDHVRISSTRRDFAGGE